MNSFLLSPINEWDRQPNTPTGVWLQKRKQVEKFSQVESDRNWRLNSWCTDSGPLWQVWNHINPANGWWEILLLWAEQDQWQSDFFDPSRMDITVLDDLTPVSIWLQLQPKAALLTQYVERNSVSTVPLIKADRSSVKQVHKNTHTHILHCGIHVSHHL